MPRLRKPYAQSDYKLLLRAIDLKSLELGLGPAELALYAHISKDTFYRRLRRPETFQIGELLKLSYALDTPLLSIIQNNN
nr:MAG TPA: Regulatory protein-modification, helix-turn-helix, transcriptional regulator, DNA [Caudoviricetes sp.]